MAAIGDILSEKIIRGGKDGIDHVWVKKLFLRNGSAVFNKRYVQGKIASADYWAERERDLLMALHLKHVPNVVQTATWRGDQDGHLLELETIDAGPTIDDWFRTPVKRRPGNMGSEYCPFTAVDELLKLLRGCLKTLKEIHVKGFVHCDIKADNISLPSQPAHDNLIRLNYAQITLIDFGYSIVNDPDMPLKRVVPVNFKQADYLSNLQLKALERDQLRHEPKAYQQLDYSCDLYSLGRMAEMIFDALKTSPGGIQPMGTWITSTDLKKIIKILLWFKTGIPLRFKDKKPGVVHDLLIEEIDDYLQRVYSTDLSLSSPFIKQDIRAMARNSRLSPITIPTYIKEYIKKAPWYTPTGLARFARQLLDERADGKPWYKKPQEIAAWIAIITFFISGAPWMYTHFVTKTGSDVKPPVVVAPPTPKKDPPEKNLMLRYEKIQGTEFWQTGTGTQPADWSQFIALLQQETKQGNHDALAVLSDLQHRGRGIQQNDQKAFQGYSEVLAAESANEKILSQVRVAAGNMVREALETGDNQLITSILPDIEKLAKKGIPYWQAVLGEVYRLGTIGKVDPKVASIWLKKAASQHDDVRVKKWAEDSLQLLAGN